MAIKKGSFVRAVRDRLVGSLEAQANDSMIPEYIFATKGEVLDLKEEYAQIKFGVVPTPPIWLRVDQLEEWAG